MKRILSVGLIISILMAFVPQSFAFSVGRVGECNTVSLGGHHSATIKTDEILLVWGDSYFGQIGNGMIIGNYASPKKIMDNVSSVSLGSSHSAAIKTDGSLWMWGSNGCGRLGNGTTNDSATPIKIMDNVSSVSLGGIHSAAIKTDGSLWMWGSNDHGQIGNGTTDNSPTPIKIMDNVSSVSLGSSHSAAIKTDGSLWMWGYNYDGQLGNGTEKGCATPVKIMDNVSSVSLGSSHSAAIKTDGSLWMWGRNSWGQIGNGTTNDSATPVKVMDNVSSISLGEHHSAAIKTDGSLWMWGYNYRGQIGNGTTDNSPTPIKIMDNVSSVSLGGDHSAAIKTDGSLWMWGVNFAGQLGNGTKSNSATPIKVMDNVKMPGSTNQTIIPSDLSFTLPSTLTVSLEDFPQMLYARGRADVTFTCDNDDVIELVPSNQQGIFETAEVSGVYVKGLTPGTATITATAPDGTSAQCVVTVEGKITETIDDELILKAKICANNHSYKYMRDCWKSPSTVVTENADLGASKTYQGINDFIDACNLDYSAKNYYEIALMDMLNNKSIYYEAAKDATNNPFLKQALSAANKKLKENANANKVTISGLNYFDVDKFYNDLTFFDGILLAKDVGTEMYEKYEQIYMLTLVTDKQIKALEAIKSTTLNDDLKKACDTVIKAQAQAAQATANEIAANTAFAGADKLGDFVVQRGWDELTNLIPGMASAKLIVSAGKLVSNGIYNADKLSTDMLTMAASSEIEEAICGAMKIYENKFLKNQTIDNALKFMATADFYKQIGIYGCDAAIEYAEDIEYSANVQEAINTASKIIPSMALKTIADLNKIVGKCDTENITEFKRLAESIKRMTADYDFYDPCGNDIASYIRDVVSTTPSEWAKPYIDKAINYNLLDTDYQNNYQNNITRAEFCTLLTYLIENKSDMSIEELAERAGRPAITVEFDDTMYVYVSEIAKLGIINGVGDNKFAPLGNITREQAAKMLCETARVLGYDISAPQTDLSGVSDWAKEGVNFVINREIMTGTNNGFEPQGTYTKEQAITTMVRFFENLK